MLVTEHAKARSRQRGIPEKLLHTIFSEADRCTPCGHGCLALEISRQKIREIRASEDGDVERAMNVILVVSDAGSAVTVLRATSSKAARPYRTV